MTITNEKSIRGVLSSIAQELLKTDITWGKIISLYCVAGGLAVDCVHHGHPEYLFGLIEAMGLVVERDAATWIAQQGGWVRKILVIYTFLAMKMTNGAKHLSVYFSAINLNKCNFPDWTLITSSTS